MDAGQRHELKSNELVEFFAQLPDFAKKYSNQIIGVCLILVALVGIPLYKHWRQQSRRAEQAAMVSRIQSAREAVTRAARQTEGIQPAVLLESAAEDLRAASQTARQKDLAVLALLEEAKLLRSALHLQPDLDAEEISAKLSRVQAACEEALQQAESPTIKAMAELQLGLCAEEGGQYEQARDIYTRIIENAAYRGTSLIEQAQSRLEQIADNSVRVVFAPAPELPETESAGEGQPAAAGTTEPAISPSETATP